MAGLDRILQDDEEDRAHRYLAENCNWYRAVDAGHPAHDYRQWCDPASGGKAVPKLVVKLTPRTPEASTVVKPTVPPGGPGLFHVKGMHLPPYMEHLWFHLVKEYGKHDAYRVANGIVHKWAQGINPGGWKTKSGKGKKVHPDVQAAAQRNIAEWEADRAKAHAQSAGHHGDRVHATAALAGGPTMSKDEAGYRTASDHAQRCGDCSMARGWHPPDFESGTCSLVKGMIEQDHVCDHWERDPKVKLAGAANMGSVTEPSQLGFQNASSVAGKYSQYGLHQKPSQTVSPSPPLPPDVPRPSPAEVRKLAARVPDCSEAGLSNSVRTFLETAAVKLEKDDEQQALAALRSAQAAVYSAHKQDLGPYMAAVYNAPGALSATDARIVPAGQSSATAQMRQGRDRQLAWRHLSTDVAALIERLRKRYFHGRINGVLPNLRFTEEKPMTALDKVLALAGAPAAGKDVSFPTESDTSQETRLLQPRDSLAVVDPDARRELDALPPLSRIAVEAHLNAARDAYRGGNLMAATQCLAKACGVAKSACAHDLDRHIHQHKRALAAEANATNSRAQDEAGSSLGQDSPQTVASSGNAKLTARLR